MVITCLGFTLLTAMVNYTHRDPMSSWVKLSGSDGKDICVTENGSFLLVNTVGKSYNTRALNGRRCDGLRIAANNRKILLINTQRELYTRNY